MDELIVSIPLEKIQVLERERKVFENIEELAESIKEKGLIHPILLDKNLVLCAGERRIRAFRLLKREEIPARILPLDHEEDRFDIELIENMDREDFRWNEEVSLIRKIHETQKQRHPKWTIRDTAKRLGKSKSLIADYIHVAEYMQEIPDLVNLKGITEVKKTINELEERVIQAEMARRYAETEKVKAEKKATAMKEVTELLARGEQCLAEKRVEDAKAFDFHGYYVGDSLNAMDAMQDGELGRGAIVECDPPFGVELDKMKDTSTGDQYQEVSKDAFEKFCFTLMQSLWRITGEDSTIIFWFGMVWYAEVLEAATLTGFKVDKVPIIWHKTNYSGRCQQPKIHAARVYENLFVLRKGNSVMGRPGTGNVIDWDAVQGDKIHPAEKPIGLIKEIIQRVALVAPGVKGFVPFLGSGNSLFAFQELKIPAFGYDLSEVYRNRFLERMDKRSRKT